LKEWLNLDKIIESDKSYEIIYILTFQE